MPQIISFPDVPGKEFEVSDDFTPTDVEELYNIHRPVQSAGRQALGRFAQGLGGSLAGLPEAAAIIANKIGDEFPSIDEGKPLTELDTYKLGKRIRETAEQLAPVDPRRKESFWIDTLPSAAGSMVGFLGAGGAVKKALTVGGKKLAGTAAADAIAGKLAADSIAGKVAVAGVGAASGMAEGYEDAIRHGASPETAWKSGLINAGLGTTEAVSLGRWLDGVNNASGGRLLSAVKEGTVEGAQEVLQQFGGNITAKDILGYDPERGRMSGVLEGGAAGGLLGSIAGLLIGGRRAGGTTTQGIPEPTTTPAPVQPDKPMFNEGKPILPATEVDRITKGVEEALSEIPAEEVLTPEPEVAAVQEQPEPEVATQEPEVAPITPEVAAPIQEVAPEAPPFVPPEPNLLPLTTQVLQEQLSTVSEPVVAEPAVEPITQGESNALSFQKPIGRVLGQTRQELELPQVVQGNTQQEVAAQEGKKEEVAPVPVELPLRASDKSVRDHTITGIRKGDVITFSTKGGPKFTFKASEISGMTEWDRKQLIERNTRHWDDEPGGAGQADRLRDSVRSVMRKLVAPKPSLQDRIDANRKASLDRAISALESKLKSPTDTTQAVLIPGLDPATARAVWNTALRIAIGVLKATKNVQRAIQAGINHIKRELAARRLTLSAAQEDDLRQSMEGEVAYKKGVLQRAALNVVRGTSLPKSMVEARRRQLDHQKFIEESIKLKSEDAKAAINAEFKTTADREAATDRLSRFLSGAIPVRAVGGPEVQLRAAALRASIDNLSLLAVNESMVTGDMATTWLGNMGEWLKRTYLAFDSTADWNYDTLKRRKVKGDVEINRIWKAAHDFLASQNPKWDEARIEAEMRSLIDRVTVEDVLGIQSKSTPGSGPKLSTEISSLLQRKDIPVEIRDWMGEIKDPYARVLQSGKWLAQFITRNLAQRELATIGLETGVLSEKKSGRYTEELFPNQLDFIPQRDPVTGEVVKDAAGNPLGQYSTRVDRRHEPLAGFWTTPEFRDTLEEFDARLNNTIATMSFGSLVGKGILTGTSYQKGALVGWNPASYMVNMIGGAVLRLASGHINPIHLFRALNAVAFGGKPIGSTSTRRALLARADYLMSSKAGTTGKGILLGDIEANLSREREAGAGKRAVNAIKGILSDPKAKGQWVKLKRSLDDLWRIPGDYGIRFMDDVFRASAFFDELSLAKSAFPTMPQDEQVKWAADRALNVYQNYDRLPKGLRDASRIGALNTFVSFKAEMFRNAYWIARYAKEGLSSSNPELKRDGAQKLAGLVIMTSLPLVLAAMSRSKNDIEDDEDAAIKRWIVPPWDRSEELVYISGKDGKYTYVPLGYLLPTFEYTRPFTTIWNAANDPNPDEAVKKAMSGWASDYLGPGAFLGPIFEAASNRRIGAEKKISMKEGMGGVKERVSHVSESFTPRGIRMLEEAYKAYNKIPGDFAKEYSMDEIAAKLAGLRERRVDVHKAAPFVLRPFGIRWREASSDENLQSRKYPPGSPEALEAKKYEAATKANLKTLYRQAITDLKRLGVTQDELISIIRDLKLPAELRQ